MASLKAIDLTIYTSDDAAFSLEILLKAPAWSSAKNNKASLRRSFTSSKNSRDVYFILTNLFSEFSGGRAVKLATGAEKANVDSQA